MSAEAPRPTPPDDTKVEEPSQRDDSRALDKASPGGTASRPPQEEELLCTICGMRSCWR